MLALEDPVAALRARLAGCSPTAVPTADPRDAILRALAEMVPSTVAEIAEACALDAATVETCLENLTARSRVMFNPLTKRYSLPKVLTFRPGLAA